MYAYARSRVTCIRELRARIRACFAARTYTCKRRCGDTQCTNVYVCTREPYTLPERASMYIVTLA